MSEQTATHVNQGAWFWRAAAALRAIVAGNVFKIVFAAGVFLAALALLGHEMKGSSLQAVGSAIQATSPSALLLAIGATVVSYGCLAMSEWWALRTIGRRLPARRIGLVTFVSYALSNGLGFSIATGTSARIRFYTAWGLGAVEAASVSVLAGTAVTLSGIVSAGAAILVVDRFQSPASAVGMLLLTPAGLWLMRLPERLWFLPGMHLEAPLLRERLLAMAGGVADWVFSGLALFVLLPNTSVHDMPAFLAIFVLGSVVSGLAGVPGGIGVFDAIVLALSREFSVVHETAAALVLYRLIYDMGPLLITATGLFADQARRLLGGSIGSELRGAIEALAPPVLAGLAFYLGAALLMTAANAPVHLATPTALAGDMPRSPLLSSVTGALLLVLASTLWRRQEAAYYGALALLIGGAAAELWRGFGWTSAGALLLMALFLAPCRSAFKRRSFILRDLASPSWVTAIALCGAAALVLARVEADRVAALGQPWWSSVVQTGRSGSLGFAAALSALALIVASWRLLGPERSAPPRLSAQALAQARKVIQAAGAVSCDAFLVLMRDKEVVFSPSARSFVMYRSRSDRWIAMGDPVGPADDRRAAIAAFVDEAENAGARPIFYAVEKDSLPDLVAAGFTTFKIGESASVDVPGFNLKGRAKENLRHARNTADKLGLRFEVYPADDPGTPWDELKQVSNAWLAIHSGVEKSFSLGAFDAGYLKNFQIAVLRDADGIVAFANIMAPPDHSELGIDLMRSRPDAPHGAMDALFVHLIAWAHDHGYRRFELGMAPLAGLDGSAVKSWSRRIERWIYHAGEALYGFEGLRAYKEKFAPEWRPIFVAVPPGATPLSVLADVALLTSGGAKGLARRPKPRRAAASANYSLSPQPFTLRGRNRREQRGTLPSSKP